MPVGFRVLYADEQVQRLLPVNPKPKASPPSMSSMPTPLYAVYRMPMSKSSVSCSRLRVSLCSVRPCLSTHVPSLCSMRAYLGSQCASPGAPNMHLRGSCKYASSHFSALGVPFSLAQFNSVCPYQRLLLALLHHSHEDKLKFLLSLPSPPERCWANAWHDCSE